MTRVAVAAVMGTRAASRVTVPPVRGANLLVGRVDYGRANQTGVPFKMTTSLMHHLACEALEYSCPAYTDYLI